VTVEEIKKLTPEQANLATMGHCPFCESQIRGFKYEGGWLAPEMNESRREHGYDPFTMHKLSCPHEEIRL